MSRWKWVWALSLVVAFCPSASFGWGDGGHEIVATIAYSRLNPRAKAEVDRLLAIPVSPFGRREPADPARRFMHAAHWADDVKRDLPATANEHFIDLPFSPDGTPLPADLPGVDNVVVALQKYVRMLRTGSDDTEKAKALRFVIHFVGDIHQPLHCATRVTRDRPEGDRGGNLFPIRAAIESTRTSRLNLHRYWDDGLGTFPPEGPRFAPPPDETIPPAVEAVLQGYPDTDPRITRGGPFAYQRWANESKELAVRIVYDDLQPRSAVPDAYETAGVEVARRQVAWAGYRLANLLNAIWKR